MADTTPEILLGTVQITTPVTQIKRMCMFLWGPSGGGKTTFAATFPRPILWINFDPDGTSSLMDQTQILIADFSMEKDNKCVTFKHENCGGIKRVLEDHPEIQTVVFDSATTFSGMALRHGVTEVKSASIEMPTLAGYGRRNSYTLQALMQLVKLTGILNKHLVVIGHEDSPAKDDMSGALMVSIMLGGKIPNEIPIRFSEVWYLEDTGKERRITIRSNRMRKPMKSRMFVQSGDSDFEWKFDPETWAGEGASDWYQKWVDNNGQKIALPK